MALRPIDTSVPPTDGTRTRDRLYEALGAYIGRLPVDQSPRTIRTSQASVGRALLDLTLSPSHVLRLTETARLDSYNHLSREFRVELSLDGLTSTQRRELEEISAWGHDARHRRSGAPEPARHASEQMQVVGKVAAAPASDLWVPILRIRRATLTPLEVETSDGHELLRLEQDEVTECLLEAVQQIIRSYFIHARDTLLLEPGARIADSKSQRSEEQNDLDFLVAYSSELDYARWLLRRAVDELVLRGLPTEEEIDRHYEEMSSQRPGGATPPLSELWSSTTTTAISQFAVNARKQARAALDILMRSSNVRRIIWFATTEHVLVAAVRSDQLTRVLHVVAPVLEKTQEGVSRSDVLTALPGARRWLVRYHTTVPSTVFTYHLTFEVDEELSISALAARSNKRDWRTAEDLQLLSYLADSLEDSNPPIDVAFATYSLREIEATISRLIARMTFLEHRRTPLLARYRTGLARLYEPRFRRRKSAHPHISDATKLAEELRSYLIDKLGLPDPDVSHSTGSQYLTMAVGPEEARAVAIMLRQLTAACDDLEIADQVVLDNDPRENIAHLEIRANSRDRYVDHLDRTETLVSLAVADDSPAFRSTVFTTAVAFVGLVYLFGIALFPGVDIFWPLRRGVSRDDLRAISLSVEPDAVISILVLVPGLLIARLVFPVNKLLVGRLRIFPRYAALALFGVTAAMATMIGGRGGFAECTERDVALEYCAVASLRIPSVTIAAVLQIAFWVLVIITLLLLGDNVAAVIRRRRPSISELDVPAWLAGYPYRTRQENATFTNIEEGSST